MRYCQENDCYQQATSEGDIYEQGYCSDHKNLCWEGFFPQGCSRRISHDDWYYKSLVSRRTGLANIQDVKRLTTWWGNNLATVIIIMSVFI